MKLAVIILAAGKSIRFGSNKLLYEIDGKKMYQRTLEVVEELCSGADEQTGTDKEPVEESLSGMEITATVVTQYEEIAAAARKRGFSVVYNAHSEEGISSSLKLGLAANMEADACFFAVADQPWLRADTLKGLIEIWRTSGKGIACAAADGMPGNPCIFSDVYFSELLALTGDQGGKKVVHAHRQDVVLLEVENKQELEDMDTPIKTR